MAFEELGNRGDMFNPSEIQNYLKDIDFPVGKQDIIDTAEQRNANESVMNMLEKLPDKEYQSPSEVSDEVRGLL